MELQDFIGNKGNETRHKKHKTASDYQQGYEAEYWSSLKSLLPWIFIVPIFGVPLMYVVAVGLAGVEASINHLPIIFLLYSMNVAVGYILFSPQKPSKNEGEITYQLIKKHNSERSSE